jgi:hypothetical protein
MTKSSLIPVTITSPTQQQIVDMTVGYLDRLLPKMNSEWFRQQFRQALRNAIRQEALSIVQVIKAADAGFGEADRALREEFWALRERREAVPLSLDGYMQKVAMNAPGKPRGRGNDLLDDSGRNLAIYVLVLWVRVNWSQKRGPAFAIVKEALGKRDIVMTARTVENIFNGIVRLAKLLDGLIPQSLVGVAFL